MSWGFFHQVLLQIPSPSSTPSREQSERISPGEIAKFSKGALNGDLQSPSAALQAASSFFIWLQAFLWENPPSFWTPLFRILWSRVPAPKSRCRRQCVSAHGELLKISPWQLSESDLLLSEKPIITPVAVKQRRFGESRISAHPHGWGFWPS